MAEMSSELELHHREGVQVFVERNGVVGFAEIIKKNLDAWKEVEVNMAVTGFSGSGKSSFINAIRGVQDDDSDSKAAEVGVIESPTGPTWYAHPSNDKIKFWDIPGIGGMNLPTLEIYCKEVKFEQYDTFLIFISNRLTKNDFELAQKIISLNKKFFFIRAKIDENVRSESRKKSFNEETMLNKIRDDCSKNLGDLVQNSRDIFLISNHDPTKWDFGRLTQAILDVLPIRQREALTLSLEILTSLSSDIVQNKVQLLRGRIWMVAAASAAAGAVPLLGLSIVVDLTLITKEISFYRSQLGLPEKGSPEFARLSADIQKMVSKFILTTAAQVSGFIAGYSLESTIEEYARFIPLVGLAIASSMSFGTTYYLLQHCLTEMEETAVAVMQDIAAQSIGD